MNIFTYWEGQQPPYIKACLQRMKELYPQLIIITPENIQEITKGKLHQNFELLQVPAQRSDCVRIAAICIHGGWFVDADTWFLNDMLKEQDKFTFSRWDDGRAICGYFYGVKNSTIMNAWLFSFNSILAKMERGKKFAWESFGANLITPLIFNRFPKECQEISRKFLIPINLDKVPYIFLENVDYRAFCSNETIAIALNNSWFNDFAPWISQVSVDELKASSTLIGSIFV